MADSIGPYEIRGELGRGAMAVVWHGWDPRLERDVAIKEPVIPHGTDEATRAELATRFVREGMAAAKLNHPGIVTVFSADVYDGRPAIVMEVIEGRTLGDLLDEGRLDPGAATAILDQLLDAAGYAHDRGVIHRDIKPDNVFVTRDGRVKLTDFGIAHLGTSATLTQAGTVMGTPGYMAPEQVTGSATDARSDLFSIGVIGYELLTGRNPFGATEGTAPTTVMYRVVHEAPPPLSLEEATGPSGSLSPVLATALAKDPAQRFQRALDFRAALRGAPIQISAVGAQPGHGSATMPAATTWAQGQPAQEKAAWIPYAAVGGVAAVVLIALLVASGGPPPGPRGDLRADATVATTTVGSLGGASAAVASPVDVSIQLSPSGDVAPGDRVSIGVTLSDPSAVAAVDVTVNGEALTPVGGVSTQFEYYPVDPGAYTVTARARSAGGDIWNASDKGFAVADTGAAAEAEITAVIDVWVETIQTQSASAHMSCYGAVVSPYFRKSSVSNADVYASKAAFFSKNYASIDHGVFDVDIDVHGPDRATVILQKQSRFVSDKTFDVHVKQQLDFAREGGDWKIVGEQDIEVY